jgi:hypothetical protein
MQQRRTDQWRSEKFMMKSCAFSVTAVAGDKSSASRSVRLYSREVLGDWTPQRGYWEYGDD